MPPLLPFGVPSISLSVPGELSVGQRVGAVVAPQEPIERMQTILLVAVRKLYQDGLLVEG